MNSRQKLIQQQFLNNEGQVLKRLKSIYTASLNDVNDKISTLEFDIDRLQFEYDWAEDGAEKSKLQSQIQSKIYQKRYQKALQEQLDGILQKMNDKAFTTVSEYLNECYDEGFIGTMYDLHGQGIPLIMPINQEAMVRAVQLDSKISTTLYKKMGENVTKLKRDIAAKVSRGIASGMSYSQVAQQIRFKMIGTYNTNGGAFGRALTIARTEGHRIQVQAGMDACNAAKDMGANVLKQWDSALDNRTRPSHRIVDGEIRELDKPFSNGLQYPGDSSGGAAEVVNCRCALLQRAKWAMDDEELQVLKDRAAFYGLDKTESFEEFKTKYLKAAEELTNTVKYGNIIPKYKYKESKTIDEAKEYLKTLGVNTSLYYKNVNVDVANMINKEITEIYNTFGNLHDMGVLDEIFVATGKTKFYAAYQRSTKMLILNKNTVSKKSSIAEMKKTAETQKAMGFWSTASGEHSVRHELGHAIDYAFVRDKGLVDNPKADEITKLLSKVKDECGITKWSVADKTERKKAAGERISYYALNDDKEFVAESVAEYMAGNARGTAKKVIEILMKEG